MNDIKRNRRTFRPELDSLEGRVVLSSTEVSQAAHLLQLQEQRQLRREQRLELQEQGQTPRHQQAERRQALKLRRQANRAARLARAGTANASLLGLTVGSAGQNTLAGASQGQAASGLTVQNRALSRFNPQTPNLQATNLAGAVRRFAGIAAPASGATITTGSGLGANIVSTGNNGLLNSNLLNTNLGNTGNTLGNLFNNVSTTPGTFTLVNGVNTPNAGGLLFNNIPNTAGTIGNNGLLNNGINTANGLVNNGINTVTGLLGNGNTTGLLGNGTTNGLLNNGTTNGGVSPAVHTNNLTALNIAGVGSTGLNTGVSTPTGLVNNGSNTGGVSSAVHTNNLGALNSSGVGTSGTTS